MSDEFDPDIPSDAPQVIKEFVENVEEGGNYASHFARLLELLAHEIAKLEQVTNVADDDEVVKSVTGGSGVDVSGSTTNPTVGIDEDELDVGSVEMNKEFIGATENASWGILEHTVPNDVLFAIVEVVCDDDNERDTALEIEGDEVIRRHYRFHYPLLSGQKFLVNDTHYDDDNSYVYLHKLE